MHSLPRRRPVSPHHEASQRAARIRSEGLKTTIKYSSELGVGRGEVPSHGAADAFQYACYDPEVRRPSFDRTAGRTKPPTHPTTPALAGSTAASAAPLREASRGSSSRGGSEHRPVSGRSTASSRSALAMSGQRHVRPGRDDDLIAYDDQDRGLGAGRGPGGSQLPSRSGSSRGGSSLSGGSGRHAMHASTSSLLSRGSGGGSGRYLHSSGSGASLSGSRSMASMRSAMAERSEIESVRSLR